MANTQPVFRNRSLVILGISESVSGIGNWITMLAVFALIVFEGEGNVTQSSGIFLAGMLPTLFAGPLAGWILDRYDRRRVMIASELLAGLSVAGLIFIDRPVLIYLLLALEAVFLAVMTPARQAVVPSIVTRQDLTRANAFLQQLAGVIKMGAPMLAGLVLAFMGPHTAIILDLVSFVLSALILSRLPSLQPPSQVEREEAGGARTMRPRTWLDILGGSAPLRLLFILIIMGTFVVIGLDVLSPIFVRDVLQGEVEFFGLIIGLIGLGTIGASVLLMLRKGNPSPWRDLLIGLTLLAAVPGTMFLASLIQGPAIARALIIAGSLVGGLGNGLLNVQIGTLLQLLTPAEALGRIGGLFQSTATAGQLLGMLVPPLLVPGLLAVGNYFGLVTAALLLLVSVITFILLRGNLYHRTDTQPGQPNVCVPSTRGGDR